MYGRVMSWPDSALAAGFELCTLLPREEAETLAQEASINPRDTKMRLAFEITKINHGEEAAQAAQDKFVKTVQNKEIPDEIEIKKLTAGKYKIIDLLSALELSASRGEAKRLIEQGGIKIGYGETMKTFTDSQAEVEVVSNLIVQRGKRQFIKISTD